MNKATSKKSIVLGSSGVRRVTGYRALCSPCIIELQDNEKLKFKIALIVGVIICVIWGVLAS